MHGLPQAVKDLTATKGIRSTQGSRIFKDFVPTADAIHVERVKRAGAIIIGKTNTPEFGLGIGQFTAEVRQHVARRVADTRHSRLHGITAEPFAPCEPHATEIALERAQECRAGLGERARIARVRARDHG